MSNPTKSKTGSLKATALSVGTLLIAAAGEALTSGELTSGGILLVGGLACYGGHELLEQNQFAFEDDLAALISDNEALAREVEDYVREHADDIDVDGDVLGGRTD